MRIQKSRYDYPQTLSEWSDYRNTTINGSYLEKLKL
jgi:hypothetical protein